MFPYSSSVHPITPLTRTGTADLIAPHMKALAPTIIGALGDKEALTHSAMWPAVLCFLKGAYPPHVLLHLLLCVPVLMACSFQRSLPRGRR